jgi:peptide/nickel transport system substrate-binding protein
MKIKNRFLFFVIVAFVLAAGLLFISMLVLHPDRFGNSSNPSPAAADAGGQKVNGRGGTVVIGMKGDFDSFNELNASDSDAIQVINSLLFMTLTRLDEHLQVIPYLAESWKFSNSGKILTYFLRNDVIWTDGIPTTADDVLFTYQMAVNPDVAYPAASRFDFVERVEALNPHTVRFHFKKAYPDALLDTQIPILPRHAFDGIPPKQISQSDFNRRPVGNGPFKLLEWKANRHVIFECNPQFILERPSVDRVIFSVTPDDVTLLANLMTGAVDVAPSLSPQDFRKIQSVNSLLGLRCSSRGYSFVAWNCAKPIFTRGVRRALTHAIDKNTIIATLIEGYAEPAVGPLMPYLWAYDKSLQDMRYDPELSKKLFDSEGWKDTDGDGILEKGKDKFVITITTNAESQLRKDAAVMIQAQLKKAGVKAEVRILEFNQLIDQVFGRKDFDALLSGWDADFAVNPKDLWHSDAVRDGYNFVSYRNPRVDSLIQMGRETTETRSAKPYWNEFQKIIVEDAPYTFLFIQDKLAAVNRKVKGVRMDVRGYLVNVAEWRIRQ